MQTMRRYMQAWHTSLVLAVLAVCGGCEPAEEPMEFRTGRVAERDIVVTVEAAGVVKPVLTVDVKSKASGEILSLHAETGDVIEQGSLLVQVDERMPRNQLALVESQVDAAQARVAIAEAQKSRAERLFQSRSINQVDYENAALELANAKADLVRAQISIENARFAVDDTEVNAPITGTVIEKLVERGQVISSPVTDVGEGTVLMRMADLSQVQVEALVNELDIGLVASGQAVLVRAAAYPDATFSGRVVKIEPQAVAEQAVTLFPVVMALENDNGLLRPGMNATVEIFIEERDDVVTVPTAALRTAGDIEVTARLLGMNADDLRSAVEPALADGAPRGADGEPPAGGSAAASTRYWVAVPAGERITPVVVDTTTLTDHEYSQVVSGIDVGTEVLLLPSSGLVESQQRLQRTLQRQSNLASMSGNGQ